MLPIALSTYHAHIAQRIDPSKRSARAQRDEALKIEVRRVFEENFRVYGARIIIPIQVCDRANKGRLPEAQWRIE